MYNAERRAKERNSDKEIERHKIYQDTAVTGHVIHRDTCCYLVTVTICVYVCVCVEGVCM